MFEIIILLLLIIVNGLFSMAETAIVSASKIRLENEAEAGNHAAQRALDLANQPNRFLSTVQIGITLVGIVSGVYGGTALAHQLENYLEGIPLIGNHKETISYIVIIFAITFLSIVLGELVPKRIGLTHPEGIAKKVALPMLLISKFSTPFVWMLSVSTEAILKLFQMKGSEEEKFSDEDITAMIEKGTETGEFEEVEHQVVESLFFLSDRTVGSLAKARKDVVLVDASEPAEKLGEKVAMHPYFIFPVFENNPDNIIGILNTRKLLNYLIEKREYSILDLTEPAMYVHDKLQALKLLEMFHLQSKDFAVVVDEIGQFGGIVTLRDVFNALVGPASAEDAAEGHAEIFKRDDNSYLIDGRIAFDEFLRFFDLPDEDIHKENDFYTLAGFVLYHLGHIPVVGEKFTWNGLMIEMVDMDGRRIDKVLVAFLEKEE